MSIGSRDFKKKIFSNNFTSNFETTLKLNRGYRGYYPRILDYACNKLKVFKNVKKINKI